MATVLPRLQFHKPQKSPENHPSKLQHIPQPEISSNIFVFYLITLSVTMQNPVTTPITTTVLKTSSPMSSFTQKCEKVENTHTFWKKLPEAISSSTLNTQLPYHEPIRLKQPPTTSFHNHLQLPWLPAHHPLQCLHTLLEKVPYHTIFSNHSHLWSPQYPPQLLWPLKCPQHCLVLQKTTKNSKNRPFSPKKTRNQLF